MIERVSKTDIEEAIKGKDDFVKIDYLKRFFQKADNMEIKKFILLKLAGICENKNLLNEAVRNIKTAAEISITYREKIEYYMKGVEIYIKLRDFENSDKIFKMAYVLGNSSERRNMLSQYKELLKMHAGIAEKNQKTRHAIEIYEKLFKVDQINETKNEIRLKLAELYDKMGRMKEAEKMRSYRIQ